jgi:hypothetical protein
MVFMPNAQEDMRNVVAQSVPLQYRICPVCKHSKQSLRNIHALFEPLLPQKAHGYCVEPFHRPGHETMRHNRASSLLQYCALNVHHLLGVCHARCFA